MAGPSDGDPDGWVEFCERQAKAAAQDFAKACLQYVQTGAGDPATRPQAPHKELLKKFVECFSEQFEYEIGKLKALHKLPNGTHTGHDESDYSEDTDSPKTQHKPFFRRLSFKGLRRGKGLFHKQHSDEVELSSHLNKHNKTKLAKIVVECRKEGLVNYLTPESLEQPGGPQKWERCRLALVKTVGGYMLEFYSPPKAQKPRSGVFCFLISEARETTALEMPDHENTFVLKADNNMEYVIEAADVDDMKSWLATIKYCMRAPPTTQPPPDALPGMPEPAPPDLPPRRDLPTSTSNIDLATDTPEEAELGSRQTSPYDSERDGSVSRAAPVVPQRARHAGTLPRAPHPLESGGAADVTLTEYVVCQDGNRQQLDVTHGSDVRMRRAELEALLVASGAHHDIRAVDNQYTFV
ncbi:hypothetical protein HF086_005240 [Spodoptera exigua]|uniref:PH domain-containing protein n=1 Tax=Spodoptera exigua TaxID=7107 RepID=A0A922MZL9_SPOEX|nr:hypothetical protein HF086_005240 [Spodoptera exigua]